MSVSCEFCVLSRSIICVGWSLVQMSPIECRVFEFDCETSLIKRAWPTRGFYGMRRIIIQYCVTLLLRLK
jgi:hypothetical protein